MKNKKIILGLLAFTIVGLSSPVLAEHHPHHDKDMEQLMKISSENSKLLLEMGAKVIQEGSKEKNPEKMLAGAQMIKNSMEVSGHNMMMHHHPKEKPHQKMDKKDKPKAHEEMMGKMGMSPEEHDKMQKLFSQSATSLIEMGNLLIKEGNTENNTAKMLKGAELSKSGFMMHHMGMGHPKKIEIEKKVIIKN